MSTRLDIHRGDAIRVEFHSLDSMKGERLGYVTKIFIREDDGFSNLPTDIQPEVEITIFHATQEVADVFRAAFAPGAQRPSELSLALAATKADKFSPVEPPVPIVWRDGDNPAGDF